MTKLFKPMNILLEVWVTVNAGGRRKDSNYLNSRAETNDGEWNVIFHVLDIAMWSALDTNLDTIMTHCLVVYIGRNSPSQERRASAKQQETGRHFLPWCYLHKGHLDVFLLRDFWSQLSSANQSSSLSSGLCLQPNWKSKHSILLTRKDI